MILLLLALQAAPDDQQKTFTLPPGFEIELVTAEPESPKIVDIAFDDAGRMWAVTATEYPLDGNESPAAAELYKRGGRDRVLVFDTPGAAGRQSPRVFADGLAMPMAILTTRDGVLIGHGPDVLLLKDTDGDGRADAREVVLSGFGIQDSHLMPHRFVRGPGGWTYFAQGAFNTSDVRTKDGRVHRFAQCKVGRFKPDGSDFETVGWGLNNIWGFVIDRRGGMWIQEANDLGYPVVPFHIGASYPGIGQHKARPYSPWRPALADFRMGGTGLSGLALTEGFPEPWNDVMLLANPITRTINAVKIHADGPRLEKRPDFLGSTDPWFRPVAIHVGPDSAIYIVDWYNKIISHNEVPRNHPDRDRSRGRVWRVRPSGPRRDVPDVSKADDLVARLRADSTWESRAAWRQIVDRDRKDLAPALRATALDESAPDHARLLAVWSLGDLGLEVPEALLRSPLAFLRREAVRTRRAPLVDDEDPEVRFESVRVAGVADLLRLIRPPSASADRAFERSLIRAALEDRAAEVRPSEAPTPEARALAALAVGDAAALAACRLDRPFSPEELELVASHPSGAAALASPSALRSILPLAGRWKHPGAVAAAARDALKTDPALFLEVAVAFRLTELEPEVAALTHDRVAVIKALGELGSKRLDLFKRALDGALPGEPLQREAVAAIAGSKHPEAAATLAAAWPQLPPPLRALAVDRLATSKEGGAGLLAAVRSGAIPKTAVDGRAMGRLKAALGRSPELAALEAELAALLTPVLRLSGGRVTTAIDLEGAFTVETWIELEPGITNRDGILGAPGIADFNFHDGRLRVHLPGAGDVIAASRPVEAEVWTHVAVTRSAEGDFRLYVNGVRDPATGRRDPRPLRGLDLGRTGQGGTAARFAEYRVWSLERNEREIGEAHARAVAEAPGLVRRFSGRSWGPLSGKAAVEGALDGPPLLSESEAAALEAKFESLRRLATSSGDAGRGREVFGRTCRICHKVGSEGVEIGPPLDGAGASGLEGLLRAILTPSAAVESGYRVLRVETKDGDVLDGRLVSQDESTLVLRIPNREDLRLSRSSIRRAAFSRLSIMPENILDPLKPEEVADLFAYLQTLR